jgi:hypothetical protein
MADPPVVVVPKGPSGLDAVATKSGAVAGTPANVDPVTATWAAVVPTLSNPCRIADFRQDSPGDAPVFPAVA